LLKQVNFSPARLSAAARGKVVECVEECGRVAGVAFTQGLSRQGSLRILQFIDGTPQSARFHAQLAVHRVNPPLVASLIEKVQLPLKDGGIRAEEQVRARGGLIAGPQARGLDSSLRHGWEYRR
jgi:hypothetical protein